MKRGATTTRPTFATVKSFSTRPFSSIPSTCTNFRYRSSEAGCGTTSGLGHVSKEGLLRQPGRTARQKKPCPGPERTRLRLTELIQAEPQSFRLRTQLQVSSQQRLPREAEDHSEGETSQRDWLLKSSTMTWSAEACFSLGSAPRTVFRASPCRGGSIASARLRRNCEFRSPFVEVTNLALGPGPGRTRLCLNHCPGPGRTRLRLTAPIQTEP